MRISDWSSDVCSSDLRVSFHAAHHRRNLANANHHSKLSHHTRRPYALGHAADLCGAGRPADRRSTAGQASVWQSRHRATRSRTRRYCRTQCRSEEHTYELPSIMRNADDSYSLKKKQVHTNNLPELNK